MEGGMSDQDLYFGDVLTSFTNGVQMELRVKLAIEFLKSPGAISQASGGPAGLATFALSLADALLGQATAQGLMKALPEDSELTQPTRRHIERQIRAQVYQGTAAHRIQSEPAVALNSSPAQFVPRRQ
jgi:hypothetical protein